MLKEKGHDVYLWSSGGAGYAATAADLLGVVDLVEGCLDKRQEPGVPLGFAVDDASIVEAHGGHRVMPAPDCKVRLEIQDDFPQEMPDETGTELLRIVQEALTNARRHSGARNVRVSLEVDGADALVAEVADDGRGFDPASANGGVGIEGMRERASLLRGYMVVCSETGKGTSVRVRVPEL